MTIGLHREITGIGISGGNYRNEPAYASSFTVGVKQPLPGEGFAPQLAIGKRMDVVRSLVNVERFGGGEIQENVPTWVVINGRESYASASPAMKGTASENNMYRLAEALEEFEDTKEEADRFQIVVADWRAFANANTPELFGLQGANYIQDVGRVAADQLLEHRITSANTHIVGHSWGTFVGYEIARNLNPADKVKTFISLDTARNTWLFGERPANFYPDQLVDYRDIAEHSWAFEGSRFGDNERSARADLTIKLGHPGTSNASTRHGLIVESFVQLVQENLTGSPHPVAKHFELPKLLGNESLDHPWTLDAYGSATNMPGYDAYLDMERVSGTTADGVPNYELNSLVYVGQDGLSWKQDENGTIPLVLTASPNDDQ